MPSYNSFFVFGIFNLMPRGPKGEWSIPSFGQHCDIFTSIRIIIGLSSQLNEQKYPDKPKPENAICDGMRFPLNTVVINRVETYQVAGQKLRYFLFKVISRTNFPKWNRSPQDPSVLSGLVLTRSSVTGTAAPIPGFRIGE
jgi:hypothetical protein